MVSGISLSAWLFSIFFTVKYRGGNYVEKFVFLVVENTKMFGANPFLCIFPLLEIYCSAQTNSSLGAWVHKLF